MRQFPIWNSITACIYKSDKSYGVQDTGAVQVLVGSSARNSTQFLTHSTTRRFFNHTTHGLVVSFRFHVDGICIKQMLFRDKNGKPAELLETISLVPAVGIK